MKTFLKRVWEWLRQQGWKILFFALAGVGPMLGYYIVKRLMRKPELAPEDTGERIAREMGKQEVWASQLQSQSERERELEDALETIRKIPVVQPASIRVLETMGDEEIAKRFGDSGL